MTILGILFTIVFCCTSSAQSTPTQTEKEWVEINIVELPEGIEVFSGITREGNPKYWVEIQGIKVFLSATNKEHYINGTKTLLLVEWYNKYLDRYKYTIRQKNKTITNKIKLEEL